MTVTLKTALLILAIAFFGCDSSSDNKSNVNAGQGGQAGSGNVSGDGGAGGTNETNDGGTEQTGGSAGQSASTGGVAGEGGAAGEAGAAGEGGEAGEAGAAGEGGGEVPEAFVEIATELERLCRTDCERDVTCNPDMADSADVCAGTYCDYLSIFESGDEDFLSDSFLTCLQTEVTFYECIIALECSAYTEFYYGEEESNFCETEFNGYEQACSAFLGQ